MHSDDAADFKHHTNVGFLSGTRLHRVETKNRFRANFCRTTNSKNRNFEICRWGSDSRIAAAGGETPGGAVGLLCSPRRPRWPTVRPVHAGLLRHPQPAFRLGGRLSARLRAFNRAELSACFVPEADISRILSAHRLFHRGSLISVASEDRKRCAASGCHCVMTSCN